MNTNNNYYIPSETEIDLIELMWRMLAQWKAILVCALIMALLVPSTIYLKDTRAYEVAQAETEKEKDSPKDPEEAIGEFLAALKPEDRPAVEQAIRNDEIIDAKLEYLNNSILVNLDTDKAATAVIGYMIGGDAAEDTDLVYALFKGYAASFGDTEALSEIRDAMGVKAEPKYIKELVWADGTIENETSNVFQVNIVCPEEAMVAHVAEASDSIMKRTCESLSKTIGEHNVKRIFTHTSPKTLESVSTVAGNAYSALYNLQSQQRAHIGTFNEDQKAAYEAIAGIRSTMLRAGKEMNIADPGDANNNINRAEENEKSELTKPGFRKKFAAIGLIFGGFLYVMVYAVLLVLSRRIDNAGAAQSYTGASLLGEYYYLAQQSGLSALFHSNAVTKHRYAKKMDLSAQVDKIAEAVSVRCTNKGVKEIALLQLFEDIGTEKGVGAYTLIDRVAEKLNTDDIGLKADMLPAFPAPNEKELSNKKNAVFFITDSTKTTILENTLNLCKDFEVANIGIVFIGKE